MSSPAVSKRYGSMFIFPCVGWGTLRKRQIYHLLWVSGGKPRSPSFWWSQLVLAEGAPPQRRARGFGPHHAIAFSLTTSRHTSTRKQLGRARWILSSRTSSPPWYLMAIPYLAPELVALIVHQLYLILLPPLSAAPSPDPNLTLLPPPPEPAPKTFLGPTQPKASGYPYPTRPTRASPVLFAPPALTVARNALLSLCLVNSTWNHEATKYLWRSVSFGLPRGFETVLQTALEYSGHVVEAGETKALERLRLDDGARPGGAVDALPDLSEDGKWAKMAGSGRKDGKMVDDGSEDLAVSPTSIGEPAKTRRPRLERCSSSSPRF